MAWHWGKPVLSDTVASATQYIRENFAELEPLNLYVAAIVDSRIVEMGSNANGEYVRWEKGLQVCWHQSLTEQTTTITLGSLYRSDYETWTYPAEFSQDPIAMARARREPPSGATGSNRANIGIYYAGGVSTTRFSGVAVLGVTTSNGGYLGWFAIGRWK